MPEHLLDASETIVASKGWLMQRQQAQTQKAAAISQMPYGNGMTTLRIMYIMTNIDDLDGLVACRSWSDLALQTYCGSSLHRFIAAAAVSSARSHGIRIDGRIERSGSDRSEVIAPYQGLIFIL
jgi:hypothetical protein